MAEVATNEALPPILANDLTPEQNDYFESGGAKEPVVTPAAEPAKPAEQAQPEPAKPADRQVPLGELLEERKARQALERDVTQLRGSLEQISKSLGQPKAAELPDFNADPAAHLMGQVNSLTQQLNEMRQFKQNMEAGQFMSQQISGLSQSAAAMERQYAATVPDYDAASKYLMNARRTEIELLEPDPALREQQLAQEPLMLAKFAMDRGRNPAELVYALAKARGYKAAASEEQVNPEAERIANIAAGQKQAQTLGSLGGAPRTPRGVKAALDMPDGKFATMSDDDFERLVAEA